MEALDPAILGCLKALEPRYLTSSVKSALAASPSLTSTSWVTTPALRWAACSLYLPGGTLAILNVPSLPETAK